MYCNLNLRRSPWNIEEIRADLYEIVSRNFRPSFHSAKNSTLAPYEQAKMM